MQYRTDQSRLPMKRGFVTARDAETFLVEVESAKADGAFVSESAGCATIE